MDLTHGDDDDSDTDWLMRVTSGEDTQKTSRCISHTEIQSLLCDTKREVEELRERPRELQKTPLLTPQLQ